MFRLIYIISYMYYFAEEDDVEENEKRKTKEKKLILFHSFRYVMHYFDYDNMNKYAKHTTDNKNKI